MFFQVSEEYARSSYILHFFVVEVQVHFHIPPLEQNVNLNNPIYNKGYTIQKTKQNKFNLMLLSVQRFYSMFLKSM